MSQRYLLSIDGGGIRGIIPLVALIKLENITGKLTRDIFSFVAGTSTGAVITAGIAAGIPASRILEMYVKRAPQLFTSHPFTIIQRIIFGYMYSTKKLHDLIADEIDAARDWTLNDSPIDLLITAKRVPDGKTWYFVRDNRRNSRWTGRLKLVDCATASAAAPTYFQPWTMAEPVPPVDREPIGRLIDGGVGVTGNPVYQACVEAFYYMYKFKPEETTTVSLGTGRFRDKKMPGWIGQWLGWILGELLESSGEQQTKITRVQFPRMLFYRIDTELKEDIPLDDIREIKRLVEIGERLAETINWKAILAGTDRKFRIGVKNTQWEQYKKEVE